MQIKIVAETQQGTYENPLWIGRKDENNARIIAFSSLKTFREIFNTEEGTWEVEVQKPGSSFIYKARNVFEDREGNACWDVSQSDVSNEGHGKVEFVFHPDENTTVKSKTWVTKVDLSLT